MRKYRPGVWKKREYESNLNKYRIDLWMTWKEFSAYVGISQMTLCALNNGMASPFYHPRNGGDIKPHVLKLCAILKATVGELFPRYACDYERSTYLTPDQIAACSVGSIIPFDEQKRADIWEALSTLTPKEATVIREHWGLDTGVPMSLFECGKIHGVGIERIRQIEAKAFRKLRRTLDEYGRERQREE